jgi:hypothetical protein
MNQERKKVVILISGVCFTLLIGLNTFVFNPVKQAATSRKERIPDVEKKIFSGKHLLSQEQKLRRETEGYATDILDIHNKHLPPASDRYIWALNFLSGVTDDLNVQLLVQEHSENRFVATKGVENLDANSVPFWVTYSVDVTMRTDFSTLCYFLSQLYEVSPFCSLASLQIVARPTTPETHDITLVLEWPVLRFEQDLELLKAQQMTEAP